MGVKRFNFKLLRINISYKIPRYEPLGELLLILEKNQMCVCLPEFCYWNMTV